jgi:hypothetical protein
VKSISTPWYPKPDNPKKHEKDEHQNTLYPVRYPVGDGCPYPCAGTVPEKIKEKC